MDRRSRSVRRRTGERRPTRILQLPGRRPALRLWPGRYVAPDCDRQASREPVGREASKTNRAMECRASASRSGRREKAGWPRPRCRSLAAQCTAADGSFQTPPALLQGSRVPRVVLRPPGLEPAFSRWVKIEAKATKLPPLAARRLAAISGRMVDSQAKPIAGVTVFQ